jgi:hypothetical protein
MNRSLRKESRTDYTIDSEKTTLEQLNTGAILRIADATEAMAKNHVQLQSERDRLQRWYNEENQKAKKLERSNAALRGQITKLRNRLSGMNH